MARQACWWNNLSQYNLKLTHIPGSKLIQADTLSCQSDHVTEDDDETIVLLPEDMFISLIATDLRDKIVMATEADELATKIRDCLQKQLLLPMRTALSDWSFTDGLLAYKGKIYILTNMELQKEVVTSFHDSPLARHPGFFKMLHLIKDHY